MQNNVPGVQGQYIQTRDNLQKQRFEVYWDLALIVQLPSHFLYRGNRTSFKLIFRGASTR